MAERYLSAGATISDCGSYRYRLWRTWAVPESPGRAIHPPRPMHVTWILLNPSVADGVVPDMTLTKCVGFSKRWGAGSLILVNLYALRSTDPRALFSAADPVGPENDANLRVAVHADEVVVAWSATPGPDKEARVARVLEMIRSAGVVPMCLGVTKEGHPRHPSRLGYDAELVRFEEARHG